MHTHTHTHIYTGSILFVRSRLYLIEIKCFKGQKVRVLVGGWRGFLWCGRCLSLGRSSHGAGRWLSATASWLPFLDILSNGLHCLASGYSCLPRLARQVGTHLRDGRSSSEKPLKHATHIKAPCTASTYYTGIARTVIQCTFGYFNGQVTVTKHSSYDTSSSMHTEWLEDNRALSTSINEAISCKWYPSLILNSTNNIYGYAYALLILQPREGRN